MIKIGGLLRELQLTEMIPSTRFRSIIISLFDLDEEAALSALSGTVIRLRLPVKVYSNETLVRANWAGAFGESREQLAFGAKRWLCI